MAETDAAPVPDLTRYDFIVTPADLARASPHAEARWYVARTNPNCEFRAMIGLSDRSIPTYAPCEIRYRGKGAARRKVRHPILVGYVFVHLEAGRSFWEVRRVDGVAEMLYGQNGEPAPVPHGEVARFAKREDDGKYDHTRDARAAKREVAKLKANLADLQAMGWEVGADLVMAILDPPVTYDEAA
jgi:hypothetical protein